MFRRRKHNISLLNEKWEVISTNVHFKHIPRIYELIYWKEEDIYYQVVNIVYNMNKNRDIFIIIEKYNGD